MLTKPISITSRCLEEFKDHVLENANSYLIYDYGNFDSDSIEGDRNLPINFRNKLISDEYSYQFVDMLQNETNGIVKLCSLYEEGDYIGWHTNSQVRGYNLILTYSDNISSYFEINGTKVQDLAGWSYKTNEFSGQAFWHRAVSFGKRITVSMLFETERDLELGISRIKQL